MLVKKPKNARNASDYSWKPWIPMQVLFSLTNTQSGACMLETSKSKTAEIYQAKYKSPNIVEGSSPIQVHKVMRLQFRSLSN